MQRKAIISVITVLILIMGITITSFAESSVNSKGRFVFDNRTADTSDDVIFDASDLTKIEEEVTEGKALIKETINNITGEETISSSNPTYSQLADGITVAGSITPSVVDLSPYANEESGATLTYNVCDYYSDYASLTTEDFLVGYKSGLSGNASDPADYDGTYWAIAYSTLNAPNVSYNASTGILTVSNLGLVTTATSNRSASSKTTTVYPTKSGMVVVISPTDTK